MTMRVNPLDLPELVALVLQHVHESCGMNELVRCVQVNKLWAAEGTSLLWTRCPSVATLYENVSRKRRFQYASKIQSLSISTEDFELLEGRDVGAERLHWPRLTKLSAHGMAYSDENQLLPFLGHRIDDLFLLGGSVSDGFITKLSSRCPRLSRIRLHQLRAITATSLLHLLEASPFINRIYIKSMPQAVTTKLLSHLGNREGLKRLHLEVYIKHRHLSTHPWGSSTPFQQLTSLSLAAQSRVITDLLPPPHGLTELELYVLDPPTDLLRLVSRFGKLTKLDITFAAGENIAGRDLVYLAERCKALERLNLCCDGSGLVTTDFTDAAMERLASHLPRLSCFVLENNGKMEISIESLKSFGKHCQTLYIWEMRCHIAIEDIGLGGDCLFPNLWNLCMGNMPHSKITEKMKHVLDYHFPSLQVIWTPEFD